MGVLGSVPGVAETTGAKILWTLFQDIYPSYNFTLCLALLELRWVTTGVDTGPYQSS